MVIVTQMNGIILILVIRHPWETIRKILSILNDLLLHLESDLSTIADIIPAYNHACQKLIEIQDPRANVVLHCLQARFMSTCSLKLPWVAYLLTQDGLQHFRNNNKEYQQKLLEITNNALIGYMTERGFDGNLISANIDAFHLYLDNLLIDYFKHYTSGYEMWNQQEDIDQDIRSLAKEILSIPCTETACERLFSALSATTHVSMCNIGPDTVNARLMVKFDYIFERSGKVNPSELNKNAVKTLNLKKIGNDPKYAFLIPE